MGSGGGGDGRGDEGACLQMVKEGKMRGWDMKERHVDKEGKREGMRQHKMKRNEEGYWQRNSIRKIRKTRRIRRDGEGEEKGDRKEKQT